MKPPALSLLIGRTAHVRHVPFKAAFHHRIALIDIDIDRLEQAQSASPLFSIGRFNLVSFNPSDHGARDGSNLRDWANARFAEAGVALDGGAVRLATFPRVCGYSFAPISLWRGYGPSGDLRGIIHEVHNTFGQSHAYVAAIETSAHQRSRHIAPKRFHVSPFLDVSGQYRFTLKSSDEKLKLIIENMSGAQPLHTASLLARRVPATTSKLIRHFGLRPFSALGVTAAIHWRALWIWLRGAGYRHRPALPEEASTRAAPERERTARPQSFRREKVVMR